MKVLMINGSAHEHGTTDAALRVIADELKAQGIDSEIVCLGAKAVHTCIGCNSCQKTGKCIFNDDPLNEIGYMPPSSNLEDQIQLTPTIFGAPIKYAPPYSNSVIIQSVYYKGSILIQY